jgi:hypothetical protein
MWKLSILVFAASLFGFGCSGADHATGDAEAKDTGAINDATLMDSGVADAAPPPDACISPRYDPKCRTWDNSESCGAHHGEWFTDPLSGDESCFCTPPDDGCPCSARIPCTIACLADDAGCTDDAVGHCAGPRDTYGCPSCVLEGGHAQGACFD